MTITIHRDVLQGTDEWLELRRGKLTASEMHLIITPKELKAAKSEKSRTHLHELLAQIISGNVDPSYVSDAMVQGDYDESVARLRYEEETKQEVDADIGFIEREFPLYVDDDGNAVESVDDAGNSIGVETFVIGFSPDGKIRLLQAGIECKSRMMKHQVATILADEMPDDFALQVHTGMLVADWEWIDFVSYCGGLPMMVKRIFRNQKYDDVIIAAARAFNQQLRKDRKRFDDITSNPLRFFPTVRVRVRDMDTQPSDTGAPNAD